MSQLTDRQRFRSKVRSISRFFCRPAARVLIISSLSVFGLSATTIQSLVSTNGTSGAYQYFISGFTGISPCAENPTLQCNNEIDIQFDVNTFTSISNGVAPATFDLMLFQPNDPVLAAGDYSAYALVANPSLAGPFSVNFTLTPGGPTPGAQTFFIEQFDNNGFFEGLTTGTTVLLGNSTPEPASWQLTALVLVAGGITLAVRSKRAV